MKKGATVDRGTGDKARRATNPAKSPAINGRWTFLTGHASVLLHIAGRADDTLREIAAWIGLTERTTASIVADLRQAGYITVTRRGRQSHYRVNTNKHLRRPAHSKAKVGDLIDALRVLIEDKGRSLTTARKD